MKLAIIFYLVIPILSFAENKDYLEGFDLRCKKSIKATEKFDLFPRPFCLLRYMDDRNVLNPFESRKFKGLNNHLAYTKASLDLEDYYRADGIDLYNDWGYLDIKTGIYSIIFSQNIQNPDAVEVLTNYLYQHGTVVNQLKEEASFYQNLVKTYNRSNFYFARSISLFDSSSFTLNFLNLFNYEFIENKDFKAALYLIWEDIFLSTRAHEKYSFFEVIDGYFTELNRNLNQSDILNTSSILRIKLVEEMEKELNKETIDKGAINTIVKKFLELETFDMDGSEGRRGSENLERNIAYSYSFYKLMKIAQQKFQSESPQLFAKMEFWRPWLNSKEYQEIKRKIKREVGPMLAVPYMLATETKIKFEN